MIRRLALCVTLLPSLLLVSGLAMARAAHPPPAVVPAPPLTPPAMCEVAIASAEATAKLPDRVLTAIALRESGRVDPDTGRARPWPWTINFEGTGHFYASAQEAITAVQTIQASGGQSIDVGCMQVNLMHHPDAFASLEEAFDPAHNAAYAGRFLKSLFAALGDWGSAIAGYHSRTPGIGEPYRDQVVATWNPRDPAVLAKLSFQPLPAIPIPIAGLPMIYAPFAEPGPIQIAPNMAYRSFRPAGEALTRSFRPMTARLWRFRASADRQSARPAPRSSLRSESRELRPCAGGAERGSSSIRP